MGGNMEGQLYCGTCRRPLKWNDKTKSNLCRMKGCIRGTRDEELFGCLTEYVQELLSAETRSNLEDYLRQWITGKLDCQKEKARHLTDDAKALRRCAKRFSSDLPEDIRDEIKRIIEGIEIRSAEAAASVIVLPCLDDYFTVSLPEDPMAAPEDAWAVIQYYVARVDVYSDHFEISSSFNEWFQRAIGGKTASAGGFENESLDDFEM